MSRTGKTLACALVVAGLAGTATVAHVRLETSSGKVLFWDDPHDIGIVISSFGSSDLPDGSDETAIRLAIEEWNAVTGTSATLVEDTSPGAQANPDWDSSGVHMIFFEETGTNPWLPPASGIVAVTPISFFGNGEIVDADILFNGADFGFTTSGEPGKFDVQDVVTHELGHLLGFDHSGWAGATMYPYVDPTVVEQRSVSRDEVTAMRTAYPSGAFGRVVGRVRRTADSSDVSRAHVVAIDADGRTSASVLSDEDGTFDMRGLDPGTYTVYATPFEGPVTKDNLGLSADPADPVDTDFEATFYGTTATITAAETIDLGTLSVDADVTISLGKPLDVYPIQTTTGDSMAVVVRGTGLNAGSTLTASDAGMTVTPLAWNGSSVLFQVDTPGGEAPGHVDLVVTNAVGDTAVLPAAFELTPPAPTVDTVTPMAGGLAGGTNVTITGEDFRAGSKVVIGDRIYTDGLDGTSVVDDGTITLTTQGTIGGTHDVVVIDPTGVEGRLASGFQFVAVPTVDTVFPEAGAMGGSTDVVITGEDFLDGAVVRINGVMQGAATVEGTTVLRFTTVASGVAGPLTLEIENPGGSTTDTTFTFVAPADPDLTTVTPATGSKSGGNTITLSGTNFSVNSQVVFGADPETGLGGTAAASVTRVDANTLEVVTPAHAGGAVSVMVHDTTTEQATLLAAAFTFKSSGGGGCRMQPVTGPPTLRELSSAWWPAALALLLVWRASLHRRPRAQRERVRR